MPFQNAWLNFVLVALIAFGTLALEWRRRRRHPQTLSYALEFLLGLAGVAASAVGILLTAVIARSVLSAAPSVWLFLMLLFIADVAVGAWGVRQIKRGFRVVR